MGFMNREALERTLESGMSHVLQPNAPAAVDKGETSGNRLRVVSACTDCDRDTLLVRVEVEGAGEVCHRGTRSCFTGSGFATKDRRVGKEAR